jgi:hypothetical protein
MLVRSEGDWIESGFSGQQETKRPAWQSFLPEGAIDYKYTAQQLGWDEPEARRFTDAGFNMLPAYMAKQSVYGAGVSLGGDDPIQTFIDANQRPTNTVGKAGKSLQWLGYTFDPNGVLKNEAGEEWNDEAQRGYSQDYIRRKWQANEGWLSANKGLIESALAMAVPITAGVLAPATASGAVASEAAAVGASEAAAGGWLGALEGGMAAYGPAGAGAAGSLGAVGGGLSFLSPGSLAKAAMVGAGLAASGVGSGSGGQVSRKTMAAAEGPPVEASTDRSIIPIEESTKPERIGTETRQAEELRRRARAKMGYWSTRKTFGPAGPLDIFTPSLFKV